VQCDAPFTLTGNHICNTKTKRERETDKTDREEPLYVMRDANQEYMSTPTPRRRPSPPVGLPRHHITSRHAGAQWRASANGAGGNGSQRHS